MAGLQRNDVEGALRDARRVAKERGFVPGNYMRSLLMMQDDPADFLKALHGETFKIRDEVTGEVRPVSRAQ